MRLCQSAAAIALGSYLCGCNVHRKPSAPAIQPTMLAEPTAAWPIHYDPAHAALPNPVLTPGDVLPDVTPIDACTPGWAAEHRHVTESEQAAVLAEYGKNEGWQGGRYINYEIDHLIPLELGGSNDIKNLWPQPSDPRPGWPEKDALENELQHLVCTGKMTLADAQNCIRRNWIQCWEKHAALGYKP